MSHFSKLVLNKGVKIIENSNLFADLYYANMACLLTPRFQQSTSLILVLSSILLMKCYSQILHY